MNQALCFKVEEEQIRCEERRVSGRTQGENIYHWLYVNEMQPRRCPILLIVLVTKH
jgi:hypothetical protein